MDMSGSMSGFYSDMVAALDDFLDTLVGSNSSVTLYSFGYDSPYLAAHPNHTTPQDVSTQAGADLVKSWYHAWATPTGGTSWVAGLTAVLDQAEAPDAVVLLADGDIGSDPDDAKLWTNYLKTEGVRFVPVGMGPSVDEQALKVFTGPTVGSDYYLANDFEDLAKALSAATTQGCTAPPSTPTPSPTLLAVTGPQNITWPGQLALWAVIVGVTLVVAARRHRQALS
ncbi:MAG: VWA domain-containing protein [Bifidobacteriaceae bacterium]|nr:VWA domain-containing protein [Bifidobacteriaceae bacterium]